MKPEVYRGSITREQFLFFEVKIIAKLILEGKTEEEIIKIIIDDNLFQLPTEKSIKSIAVGCYKRIKDLNVNVLNIIAYSSAEEARQAALYALMKYNKIVWDFMIDVIGFKYSTKDLSFDKSDVTKFLSHLQYENEDVATWSEQTINKIRSVLIKCLADSGFLNDIKSKELNYIFISQDLLDCIRQENDEEVLPSFNYFD